MARGGHVRAARRQIDRPFLPFRASAPCKWIRLSSGAQLGHASSLKRTLQSASLAIGARVNNNDRLFGSDELCEAKRRRNGRSFEASEIGD